ncbi:Mor transcription activator family protein [Pectobacterium aroidearum]|uniref:Mor transcription activator family protein n=1 Tax=Pectobacterium aroidearum TaxID=1201031 RepID=UPI0032EB0A2C
MNKGSFKRLLNLPPHRDISNANRFVIERAFTLSGDELVREVNRLGYDFSAEHAREHIKLLKKQIEIAVSKFGENFDLECFCDVGATNLFDEYLSMHDDSDFYKKALIFNPDYNIKGELSSLKRSALIAVRHQRFSKSHSGIDYFYGACENALKKIGVNPNDEISGVSKSLILTMEVMAVIGGMQFYLPKAIELHKAISDVDMYIDSISMSLSEVALKYGVSYKTISIAAKRVRLAMKEYEEGK